MPLCGNLASGSDLDGTLCVGSGLRGREICPINESDDEERVLDRGVRV